VVGSPPACSERDEPVVPLEAREVHAAARTALDAPLAALGFRRMPRTATAAWLRPEGDRWLLLWFQPDRWNGPQSAGFKFTVEIRLADRAVLYANGRRARLPALLAGEDREQLRRLENRAIAKVPGPDRAHLRSLPDALRDALLADRKPRLEPYRDGQDVWFRHQDRADLEALLAFIERTLPAAIDRFMAAGEQAPEAG
jgi:hypothetical protein